MTEETKEPVATKAKAPAIEDKPLAQFAQEHLLPQLAKALEKEGITQAKLSFEKQPIMLSKNPLNDSCSQLIGQFNNGHQFNIYFLDENLNGKKYFSYTRGGGQASTLESFMIDERKTTLDILVLYILQRLNAQKWLSKN